MNQLVCQSFPGSWSISVEQIEERCHLNDSFHEVLQTFKLTEGTASCLLVGSCFSLLASPKWPPVLVNTYRHTVHTLLSCELKGCRQQANPLNQACWHHKISEMLLLVRVYQWQDEQIEWTAIQHAYVCMSQGSVWSWQRSRNLPLETIYIVSERVRVSVQVIPKT